MEISCPLFDIGEKIPEKYTCDGKDVNPPLEIKDIPQNTKSLALIVDDPDAPSGTFTHWVVYNIPPKGRIEEDSKPGVQGVNDFHKNIYQGPCPPSGDHRYYFKLYALDDMLDIKGGEQREKVISEMQEHILESCNTMGQYSKKAYRR